LKNLNNKDEEPNKIEINVIKKEDDKKDKKKGPKAAKMFGLLGSSLSEIMKTPISRWTTVGASMRYFGTFTSDYYLPLFYLTTYPTHRTQFALLYSLINIFCGFVSSLGGGVIADRLGKGRPMMKAWVCVAGNLLALPFFIGSVLITNNFGLSMACTALRFLFGEPFRSPSVTMLQNSTKPEKFGNLIAAYQCYQKMATIAASLVVGVLFNGLNVAKYPGRVGPILAGIATVAYGGSALAYYLAGNHYLAFKRHIKYRSIFAKDR